MDKIMKNVIAKLNKSSTLDEIKTNLKEECENSIFKISSDDWNELFNEIVIALN